MTIVVNSTLLHSHTHFTTQFYFVGTIGHLLLMEMKYFMNIVHGKAAVNNSHFDYSLDSDSIPFKKLLVFHATTFLHFFTIPIKIYISIPT